MSKYRVKIIYEYPVDAVDAEDAFATIPLVARLKYLNAEGAAEVINSEGKVLLRAKRVDKSRTECFEKELQDVTDTGKVTVLV